MLFDFIKPKEGSTALGLKYVPTSEPERSDDEDHVPWARNIAFGDQFSPGNKKILRGIMKSVKPKTILEIGVCKYDYPSSSSRILMEEKSDDCIYLGVDILDKSHLRKLGKNVHTIMCSSLERDKVKEELKKLGVDKLDLLMIDGWHSVNAVVNDWQYTELLSDHGAVLMHDTNAHTGPVAVFDAIDETLWNKKKYCLEKKNHRKYGKNIFADWGVAVAKRKLNG